jgi:hypothetical protein
MLMIIFLKNIVTIDETWVYGHDIETKSPIFTLGLKNVSQIQQSPVSLVLCESDAAVLCESDAACVFWLWGHSAPWIPTLWADGEQGIVSKSDGRLRGNEEKRGWFVEGKIHCSIMTTLWHIPPCWFMIFSHNMKWCSSPNLRTCHTWHQWTSVSSLSWNSYWKDDDLHLLRLKKICWQSYAVFQKRHSRNACKTEKKEMLGAVY